MKTAKLVAALSVGMVLAGIGMLVHTEYGYRRGREEYDVLQEKFTSQADGTESKAEENGNMTEVENGTASSSDPLPVDAPEPVIIDWKGLRQENGDVVGWVELPAAGISYPVLQGRDNEYYLHHDIHGEYLFAGSIFLDSESSPLFRDQNAIIYGHNMNDGSMFAPLKEYADSTVWEGCPYFWIYTPEASCLYRIGSVHTAEAGGNTYLIRFPDSQFFTEWLEQMLECSVIETGVQWGESDRIVTLSTCTGQEGQRWVVQGAKIAELELPTEGEGC